MFSSFSDDCFKIILLTSVSIKSANFLVVIDAFSCLSALPNGWEVSENEEGIPYFIE